jgi:dTMP kinase
LSLFITFEGPEGSGKSTQAAALSQRLRRTGLDVLLTREPGGTPIGDQIRGVLTSLDNTGMDPHTEFLLFSASRAQLARRLIAPHLEAGGVAVSDRFFHSSLAYQGFGHGLDLGALRQITAFATGGLMPDLIVLLDLPVEQGLKRRQKDGHWNRLDAYDLDFHRRIRQGYLQLAREDPRRWTVIDADQPPPAVEELVWQAVLPHLKGDANG